MALAYLTQWISQVVLIVLFATILELLLPSDAFQKYVKLVIGLVLIIALLNPLMKILNINSDDIIKGFVKTDDGGQIKNSMKIQKNEIERAQAAYIHKQMAVQMKNNVKEALSLRYGLSIKSLEVATAATAGQGTPSIKKTVVVLGQAKKQQGDKQDGNQDIQPVKDVAIHVTDKTPGNAELSETQKKKLKEVKAFLAGQWGIAERAISIRMEGGG